MAKGDRYHDLGGTAGFGLLANALFDRGGDAGASFPRSDAEDMSRGARFIPGDVTLARRRGEGIHFNTSCRTSTCCWYWQMPNGSRIYHFDRGEHEKLMGKHDGKCPECGNANIRGGIVSPQ